MQIGYARVSTFDQDLSLQRDALEEAGCERIFADTISGAKANRPQLAAALDHLRPGDTLVVWRLDPLGRSLSELIDTTTSGGKLIFHIFWALAEFTTTPGDRGSLV